MSHCDRPRSGCKPPIAVSPVSVTVSSMTSSAPHQPAGVSRGLPIPPTTVMLGGMNDAQVAAVRHRGSPLLILAGPGSGKTRVLTHRIADLVLSGLSPERILAVTFTNKAAEEMRRRLGGDRDERTGEPREVLNRPYVPGLLPPLIPVPSSISTFHSLCLRTLRFNADLAGIPRGFAVFDTADSLRVIRDNEPGLEKKDAQAIFEMISSLRNVGVLHADDLESAPAAEDFYIKDRLTLAAQWRRYEQRMVELGALDFDDLLVKMVELLRSSEASRLSSYYDAFLVDEFQDTNVVQYEILLRLAGPNRASREVCVVGDPEQAIFGWRGGSPVMMDKFVEDFAPARIIELGENYRSTPQIVAAAQRILDASTAKLRIKLYTNNPPGPKESIVSADDAEDEAERVVASAARAVDGGESFAVLVRTKAQTNPIELALGRENESRRRRNLPPLSFSVVGAQRFAERAEVKDALAYLRVVLNPKDDFAFERAACAPRRGLGPAAFDKLRAFTPPGSSSLYEKLMHPNRPSAFAGKIGATFSSLAEVFSSIEAALDYGVESTVKAVLDSGLYSAFSEDVDRRENLDELRRAAARYDRSSPAPGRFAVEEYVGAYALSSSTDSSMGGESGVTIITAHAAKGNEFDHVWIAGLDEDVFPHLYASTPEAREEERRLLYVAASRPRRSLTLSHRRRRMLNGKWGDARPSKYLEQFFGFPSPSDRSSVSSVVSLVASSSPAPPRAILPGVRLNPQDVPPGTLVEHNVFGTGTVVSLVGSHVEIEFSSPPRRRKLDLSFAPLRLA